MRRFSCVFALRRQRADGGKSIVGRAEPARQRRAARSDGHRTGRSSANVPHRHFSQSHPTHPTMKKQTTPQKQNGLNRRQFLSTTAKGVGLAALLSGLPKGWIGSVFASDAPETADMKFGIIALTDCSPIVIAHEKGLFKKYGINSIVAKGANWAAIRDSLRNGDNQATHMLIG